MQRKNNEAAVHMEIHVLERMVKEIEVSEGGREMTLEELLWVINDNTIVDIFSAETGERVASYDGKDEVPENLNEMEITDVFVDGGHLCIEIEEV